METESKPTLEKFPLSSLPMSEFVLKDFLSQGSTCLITAIAKTVNS